MATSTPYWQRLIWGVMFLVVCEGAVRKWIAPGIQAEIYLVKDAMLVIAYIGFLRSRVPTDIQRQVMRGLSILLAIALGYFVLQILNQTAHH
jgi:ABC-type amino acid transport system permease subunit